MKSHPRTVREHAKTICLSVFLAFLLCLYFVSPAAAAVADEPVQVKITGVEGEVLGNVRAALTILPDIVAGGVVNKPWLERFERQIPEKVQRAVEPFGYYNARVSVKQSAPDERTTILDVAVAPGPQVRVTAVDISIRGPGAAEPSLRFMATHFPLKKGDVLRADRYEKAKGDLKARAQEAGYEDADYSTAQVLVSRTANTARLELALETGPRYYFGPVSFSGADMYPDSFLARYLAFKPGDAYSPSALSTTQLNLINSDRFKDVMVIPEKDNIQDFRIPLHFRLDPSLPKRLRFGVGYGTDTGARFTTGYKDLNIHQGGHELDTELNLSQYRQGLVVDYRIPGADINSYTGLAMKLQREDLTTYVSRLASFEVSRTRGFGPGRIGAVFTRFQREISTVGVEDVDATLIMPGVRFSEQRYDNLIRPRKGYRWGMEMLGTDKFLGSNTGLIQVQASGKAVIPLPWRLSAIPRVQGAATFERDLSSLPASLRFFAGGSDSVRGYSYQSLGPKDAAGNVVGGRNLIVGSLELERAVGREWGIACFYDAGNAFNILTDLNLAQGAGVGVRYYTALGAIRFDVARQVGIENPGYHIHVSLGFQL